MNINELEKILNTNGIVFLAYGGMLSQDLLVTMTEALEKESEINNLSTKVNINLLTIFIELTQNMMSYSKSLSSQDKQFDSKGLIIVGHENSQTHYFVFSKNIISSTDKEKISNNIKQFSQLDKEALRAIYRERRKNGHEQHAKGAGLGFAEIARRCDAIEYDFSKIENSDNYHFVFKATLNTQEK